MKQSHINRLCFSRARALLSWLQAPHVKTHEEPARLLAANATRELGFKITLNNLKHVRQVVRELSSANSANPTDGGPAAPPPAMQRFCSAFSSTTTN